MNDLLQTTHNIYDITFNVNAEISDYDGNDVDEARENSKPAIDNALSDLSEQIVKAINSINSKANAVVSIEDSEILIDEDSWINMNIYINNSLSREDALKCISNSINCVGIGSAEFETLDYDNGYTDGYGDNIPACYQGWTEYPEIDASVDVQLTVVSWSETVD